MKRLGLCFVVLVLSSAAGAFALNDLQVVAPGLNSTGNALRIDLDDSNNNVFVETQHPSGESHYRIRFWIDPTGLANLAPNTSIRIGGINSTDHGQRIVFFLRHDSPGSPAQYQVNVWGMQDAGAPSTYTFIKGVNVGPVATPVANQVEIEWTRSSNTGVGDAIIRIQRITPGNVGTNQQNSTLVMRNFLVDDSRYGVLAGSGTNMTGLGSFKFDEFESYR